MKDPAALEAAVSQLTEARDTIDVYCWPGSTHNERNLMHDAKEHIARALTALALVREVGGLEK